MLCVIILLSFAQLFGSASADSAEKIVLCTATIEDKFAVDEVIVMLKSSYSKINQVHDLSFFDAKIFEKKKILQVLINKLM